MKHTEAKKEQLRRRANIRRAADREIADMFPWGFYKSGPRKGCPKPKNPARRKRCQGDAERFLMTYFHTKFYLPMSPGQQREIQIAQQIIEHGGQFALAAPRGDGKTTRIERLTLYAMLYGLHRFVVPVGSDAKAAEDMLDEIKAELLTNDTLMEDFPEVCIPARAADDSPHKAKTLTIWGEGIRMRWNTESIIFPSISGSVSSGSIMKPRGLTGRLRGMKHSLSDGRSVRPTLFLLDDPQTDDSAKSPSQCKYREKLVKGAVMGSGGPTDKISAFMPCTVIEQGDLAARFLDRDRYPEWHGMTRGMVITFPDAFAGKDGDKSLWERYREIRDDEFRADAIIPIKANEFYRQHQEQMDAGAEMDNPHRIAQGDLSAVQTAMNLYFDRGADVFWAEYQNDPTEAVASIYTITPRIVASRTNGYARFQIPDEAQFLVSMADINYIGLTYTTIAFANDFTGWIIDYGKYPEGRRSLVSSEMTESEIGRQIAKGVQDLWELQQAKVFTHGDSSRDIDLQLIDANFWTRITHAVVKSLRQPRTVIADRGRPSTKYQEPPESRRIGKPGHYHHLEQGNYGVQCVHDADFWRMTTQKAFLVAPGVPGSLSLWGDDPKIHADFAEEICAERLVQYVPGEPADLYQWIRKPGLANDKLDATVGCYPAAGLLGAVLAGTEPKSQKRADRRRQRRNQSTQPKSSIRTRY